MTYRSEVQPRPSVLVVDDDDDFRAAIACVLRARGCEVVALRAASVDTLAAVMFGGRQHAVHALVADARSPGLFALASVVALRAPIVLTTTQDTSRVRHLADALGADVLGKPLDVCELEAVVERLWVKLLAVADL